MTRMTDRPTISDGTVQIGSMMLPYAVDTLCSLSAVVSFSLAQELKGEEGVRRSPCRVSINLGLETAKVVATEKLEVEGAVFKGVETPYGRSITIPKLTAYIIPGKDNLFVIGRPMLGILGPTSTPQFKDHRKLSAYVGNEMYEAQDPIDAYVDPTKRTSKITIGKVSNRRDLRMRDGSLRSMVRTLDEQGTATVYRDVTLEIIDTPAREGEYMIIGRDMLGMQEDPDSIVQRITGFAESRDEATADAFEARMVEAREAGASPRFLERIEGLRTRWKNLRLDLEPQDPVSDIPPLEIRLKPGVESAKHPRMYFVTLSKAQHAWLPGYLKKMERAGVMVKESGTKPGGCYSPVLFPRKPKSTTEWRLVTDSRHLNSIVEPVVTDIPKLDDLRRRVGAIDGTTGPATCFATADIVKGYWTIAVKKEDQKFLRCKLPHPFGAWRFTRASMGFARSGNYFISQVQGILAEIIVDNRLIVGTDDLCMLGRQRGSISAEEDLLMTIERVMKVLVQHRIPISPKPSSLQVYGRQAKWCGYILKNGTIEVDPERIEGLVSILPPRTGDELVQFIGAVTWIKSHILNFAALMQPLNDFKTKMYTGAKRRTRATAARIVLKDIGWDDAMNGHFEKMQEAVSKSITHHQPGRDSTLILFTDASGGSNDSGGAWGGLLAQCKNPERDKTIASREDIQPIAFFGGTFTGHEKRWHVPDKEAAATIFSMRKAFSLIGGRSVTIYTDARNLKETFSANAKNSTTPRRQRIQRWHMELLAYTYNVVHIEGKSNLWADMISRQYVGSETPQAPTFYRQERMSAIFALEPHAHLEAKLPSTEQVVESQRTLTPGERTGRTKQHGLWRDGTGKIVIPMNSELCLTLLICAHQGAMGHRGLKATMAALEGYTWEGKDKDVKTFVSKCISCMKAADGTTVPRPLGRQLRATKPFEIISADFLTLPQADGGERHLLVIKDRFSRIIDAEITDSCDAYTAAKGLSRWCSTRPIPGYLLSDGGTHFTSRALKIVAETFKINHRIRTPYNSQSSGSIENANKQIVRILKKLLNEFRLGPGKWPLLVRCVITALNHTPSEMLDGKSSSEVAQYLESVNPIDLPIFDRDDKGELRIKGKFDASQVRQELEEMRAAFEAMHPRIEEKDARRHRENKTLRDRKAKAANFNVGEYVLIAKAASPKAKTDVRWDGPFEVIASLSPLVYKCQRLCRPGSSDRGRVHKVHAARLRTFAPAGLNLTSKLRKISWDGLTYKVEKFNRLRIEQQGKKRNFFLGVRWVGFEKINDTDEPLDSIYAHVPRMVRDYIDKYKKLSPDQRRDVERQMDLLDGASRGNDAGSASGDGTGKAINVYGSELRDGHRDDMTEAWFPGNTSRS